MDDPNEIAELLISIPYLILPPCPIPPLTLINSVLQIGRVDSGMSGLVEWSPFEISSTTFDAVKAALQGRREGLFVVCIPSYVASRQALLDWQLMVALPEHAREIQETGLRLRELTSKWTVLHAEGLNNEAWNEAYRELTDAQGRMQEFALLYHKTERFRLEKLWRNLRQACFKWSEEKGDWEYIPRRTRTSAQILKRLQDIWISQTGRDLLTD